MKKFRPSFLPAITWFVLSVILLTLPGSAFPSTNWLSRIWIDKWVHIALFSILIFLFCWGCLKLGDNDKLKRYFLIISATGLFYGIAMEFVQKYLVVNRDFDLGDIMADAIGCALGWVISSRWVSTKN